VLEYAREAFDRMEADQLAELRTSPRFEQFHPDSLSNVVHSVLTPSIPTSRKK